MFWTNLRCGLLDLTLAKTIRPYQEISLSFVRNQQHTLPDRLIGHRFYHKASILPAAYPCGLTHIQK